jgi:uncharacterized membrane protein
MKRTYVRILEVIMSRVIPLSVHGAIETLVGPAIIAAPFVLGLGEVATVVGFVLGVFVLGLALQVPGPRRSIPLSAHAGFDYALAVVAVIAGVAIGIGTGEWAATAFLAGFGVIQVALTASTRFSVPAGA